MTSKNENIARYRTLLDNYILERRSYSPVFKVEGSTTAEKEYQVGRLLGRVNHGNWYLTFGTFVLANDTAAGAKESIARERGHE